MKRTGLSILLLVLLLSFGFIFSVQAQGQMGTNWTAQFYDNINFTGNPYTVPTTFNGLNFNWPTIPNINGVIPTYNGIAFPSQDNFSARFTSNQNFTQGGYQFIVAFDDRVRVYIDGVMVLEDLSGGPTKERRFTQQMSAGTHSITVEFIEITGAAMLQFQWAPENVILTPGAWVTTAPGGTPQPMATPIPPLTASLINVRGLAVRTGPYLGASMVAVALPDNNYPVHAQNTSAEGVTWYQITVNGKTGWSSGRYLAFSTPPDGLGTTGSVFDTLGNPEETGVIAIPRSVMRLRQYPSTRAAELNRIPWGEEVPVYNRTVQGGKDFWYQVRYEGQLGWIHAPYVGIRGNIHDVPIR